jgi:hypothetical protein
MGFHLLVIAAARGVLQVLHLSAPWLNLWLPSARNLPEACAVFYGALVSHAAYGRGTIWSHHRRGADDMDEYIRLALLSISY